MRIWRYWNNDFSIRYKQKQAIVYGSRFNKDFQATAFGTSNIRDIELFKGSKYVQSLIGHDTFKKIKHNLTEMNM